MNCIVIGRAQALTNRKRPTMPHRARNWGRMCQGKAKVPMIASCSSSRCAAMIAVSRSLGVTFAKLEAKVGHRLRLHA